MYRKKIKDLVIDQRVETCILQHLNLIIFYNDDFGIVNNDLLPLRVDKFCRFFTEF
ncbi:hypothetical protein BYT27DRAFT_7116759 [Phlegmacium glaucopus]|nr:hypothetical protein BYT27DRAFT_7116759 [Phlegmacium glaucopus]